MVSLLKSDFLNGLHQPQVAALSMVKSWVIFVTRKRKLFIGGRLFLPESISSLPPQLIPQLWHKFSLSVMQLTRKLRVQPLTKGALIQASHQPTPSGGLFNCENEMSPNWSRTIFFSFTLQIGCTYCHGRRQVVRVL